MLHRKGEFETARLDDFAFRVRARTMRHLAERLGRDPVAMAALISNGPDENILDDLAKDIEMARSALDREYRHARTRAEAELRNELGDPAPVRLA